jgi:tRNA(Ile)-lysidine synthase
MDGTRKVQDYFVDAATPQDERDHVPIVEADGRIAWIVGGAIGAEFAVSDTTQSIVEIEVLDAPE